MRIPNRVAIVGCAGLFSSSPTLDHFWRHILASKDTSQEVPCGRWRLPPSTVYDKVPGAPDHLYCTRGYFVSDWHCEPDALNIDRDLLARLDPLFHITLATARRAWNDAVTAPLDRSRVGAIFGNIVLPTEKASSFAESILIPTFAEQLGLDAVPTMVDLEPLNLQPAGMPARLLARALGIGHVAFTVDAACASSLFALKLAVDELLSGRADAMLTGGVCRPDCFYTQMGFSQLRALSHSGRCRPFDVSADGLLVGEGAGFFVLKRLEDALHHGDAIHGIIAGIGLSNDTCGNLLAPDGTGQLRALKLAYQQAGWEPEQVDLIECHATGTPVGDRVELGSLHELWRGRPQLESPCVLGSVKANVGHTLTAAGSAGLLKVLLALRHRKLPPSANCEQPQPELSSSQGPFCLLHTSADWQPRRPGIPRRAAVSAFGFGGTNAHALIEEWLPPATTTSFSLPPQNGRRADKHIAVIGEATQVGDLISTPASPDRWWGVEKTAWFRELSAETFLRGHHLIDSIRLDAANYPIPPRDLEEMLPQQLLMLQVATRALADAGWSRKFGQRTGVVIGLRLDLNTTNFHVRWALHDHARRWAEDLGLQLSQAESEAWSHKLRDAIALPLTPGRTLGALASTTASRIARVFGIGGPSFTLCNETTSGLSALHVASSLLQRGDLDYVLVGAVDLGGDVRELVASYLTGSAELTVPDIAWAITHPTIIEGAAALVVHRAEEPSGSSAPKGRIIENKAAPEPTGAILGLLPLVNAGTVSAGRNIIPATAQAPTGHDRRPLVIAVGHPAVQIDLPPANNRAESKTALADQQAVAISNTDAFVPQQSDFPLPSPKDNASATLQPFLAALTARAEAHAGYLRFSQRSLDAVATVAELFTYSSAQYECASDPIDKLPPCGYQDVPSAPAHHTTSLVPELLNRQDCLEFATGSIGKVLGPEYAKADSHPTRVRLPAEPLMLVDRVLAIEGEPHSLGPGRIVTEHDVRPDAWYLENGRVAACVAIESGQADLLLSAYLGIDARTRGLAVYRLLDATVTFHRGLPTAGTTLHYDIQLDGFFRQGDTHLFRFRFEAAADGQPLLTMTDGCAGFFTLHELEMGQGIRPRHDVAQRPAPLPPEWQPPFTLSRGSYATGELAALRRGDLGACFGEPFGRLRLREPVTLPDGKLRLLDRVTLLDPRGGIHGRGLIRAEQDIDPGAWFLSCHFVDDRVMPGTLMYECCLQTLRFFLLQHGWVAEAADAQFEPVPGIATRLRCRGQVTATVNTAAYELTIKRVGFAPEPFAIADALLYADGKPIVEITDLSLRLAGVTQRDLDQAWK
jgi:3-oxoacyl-(acyl-carrier-protein) synthase/3-hydroxymyristoyl/3-hydroxydecanoyl-(acyl carrier protein) dehydratase